MGSLESAARPGIRAARPGIDAARLGIRATRLGIGAARGPAAIAALLLIAVGAPCSDAAAADEPFSDLVRGADVIFAGTVSDAQCTRLKGEIITRITFKRLTYVKGSGPKDSLTVRRPGGILQGEMILADDQPGFCVGERCVLLTRGDSGAPDSGYAPFPSISEGVFRLFEDSPKKKPVVHTSIGTPVAAVTAGRLVLAEEENADRRMSENAFLDALRKIVREQGRPASGRPKGATPEQGRPEPPGASDSLR